MEQVGGLVSERVDGDRYAWFQFLTLFLINILVRNIYPERTSFVSGITTPQPTSQSLSAPSHWSSGHAILVIL